LSLTFEPECQAAVDIAKRAVASGAELDIALLLAALLDRPSVRANHPELAKRIPAPTPLRDDVPAKVPLSNELKPLLQALADNTTPVTAPVLFEALVASEAGRRELIAKGVPEAELPRLQPRPASEWRSSSARKQAIEALSSFGRMLTDVDLPASKVEERDDVLRSLLRTLSKMKRRNAILVGPSGTGKTAIVLELARRLRCGDASIPERLRDLDLFELSPVFLKSGASVVGEYEARVKKLLQALESNPKIVLFVDEIHSLLSSGMHERGPFTEANEGFKAALGRGQITCIGCTTPAEYRHYIEPDKALERRFQVIRLEAPSREATLAILRARRPRVEKYYGTLRIPDAVLEKAVALTEDHMPSRYQPDKSIQLLDEACALCATSAPPKTEVDEESLLVALESTIGRSITRCEQLTEPSVFERLRAKIVGQDEVLRGIARAFVAGLEPFLKKSGPRGVFLFAGPTGVGKTETALVLAKILGSGREELMRIDCNTLPSDAHDGGQIINRLLGVPPGYIGYARGQGGMLSRVRDCPESIVLFDEFEKAGPAVGRLLLQIIDDGRVDDVDGNTLDFRRAFVVFTTNAGCSYDARHLGFAAAGEPAEEPRTDLAALKADLRALGLGEEFLGRISHTFVFGAMKRADIEVVIARQLESLKKASEVRGLELSWSPELVAHLSARWQPRYGVRFATAMLKNRIGEQLSIASAQGELHGVKRIALGVCHAAKLPPGLDASGLTSTRREGDTIHVELY
jgi:ATP-dependent Clp protease ATP-binding subunit ClpA